MLPSFFPEYDENCYIPENSSARFCWTEADVTQNHQRRNASVPWPARPVVINSESWFKAWLKSCVVFMIRNRWKLFYNSNSERKDGNPPLEYVCRQCVAPSGCIWDCPVVIIVLLRLAFWREWQYSLLTQFCWWTFRARWIKGRRVRAFLVWCLSCTGTCHPQVHTHVYPPSHTLKITPSIFEPNCLAWPQGGALTLAELGTSVPSTGGAAEGEGRARPLVSALRMVMVEAVLMLWKQLPRPVWVFARRQHRRARVSAGSFPQQTYCQQGASLGTDSRCFFKYVELLSSFYLNLQSI